MKTEPNIETTNPTIEAVNEAQPRKLLLGKRVLRHFGVRTSIQTGAGPAATGDKSDAGNTAYSLSIQRCR